MIDLVFIELTHRCNLKCKFCFRHLIENGSDLRLNDCIRIIDEAKKKWN